MQDPDPFTSYKELIIKGWFENKLGELESILQVLEAEARITPDQRERLLRFARDRRMEDTTPLGRNNAMR
jgi:hypothetical protein